LTELHTW